MESLQNKKNVVNKNQLWYWNWVKLFGALQNNIVQNKNAFKIWTLKNHSFSTVKFCLRFYWNLTHIMVTLHERKWMAWSQEPLNTQKACFQYKSFSPPNFNKYLMKMYKHLNRIRQNLAELITWEKISTDLKSIGF